LIKARKNPNVDEIERRPEKRKTCNGMPALVRGVTDKVSRYIDFERNVIFKDPKGPHL